MAHTWHYEEPRDGILHVTIDCENRSVNVLSQSALEELATVTESIRQNPEVRGVLFSSGKPGCFIAGADVKELQEIGGPEAAGELSQWGHQVFREVENLAVPTVALISGTCLGGGLEFAMSCRYRIAGSSEKTLLGLPEVNLGLIPAWGGTVRLPRLTGLIEGLQLILAGRRLNGFQARSRGLVDDVVADEALPSVGEKILKVLAAEHDRKRAEKKLFPKRKKQPIKYWLQKAGPVRSFVFRQAQKQIEKKTRGRYPAPGLALDTIRAGIEKSADAGFNAESKAVTQLSEHPVTSELIRLFFLNEEAKKSPTTTVEPIDPKTISQSAVIGAGAMGAGIALLAARRGIWTRLKDIEPSFVANGLKAIHKMLQQDVRRRRLTQVRATGVLDHISPTTDYRGLLHADVVVEAIIEEPDIKRRVFRELAEACSPETVLATNTSSLLVSDIAQGLPHPERIVGLHFFNPPHKMPLVEIIRTPKTSDEALAKAIAFVSRLGKTMVVVGDCAGFLVNRLLAPYMNEAGHLLAEVIDPMEIDRAAVEFGMPMGPLELTDLVGIDVAQHVACNMHAAYGSRMEPAPIWERLRERQQAGNSRKIKLVERTRRGKRFNPDLKNDVAEFLAKAGSGNRPSLSRDPSLSREMIVQRLIYPLINEASRSLDEGIVQRPSDIDLAMVFGTGFAPFRGGPLRFADSIGLDKIVATLDEFSTDYPRLAPSDALRALASNGNGFYGRKENTEASAVAHTETKAS